jgi:hypothetical protein
MTQPSPLLATASLFTTKMPLDGTSSFAEDYRLSGKAIKTSTCKYTRSPIQRKVAGNGHIPLQPTSSSDGYSYGNCSTTLATARILKQQRLRAMLKPTKNWHIFTPSKPQPCCGI